LTSWKELYLNTDLPMDKFIVTYYQTDLSDSEMTTFNCIIFFKDKVQINIDMCNNFNIKNDWKDIPFKTLDLQRVHQPIKLIKHLFNYQPDFHCSQWMRQIQSKPMTMGGCCINRPKPHERYWMAIALQWGCFQ
jgi:hypothetical protein